MSTNGQQKFEGSFTQGQNAAGRRDVSASPCLKSSPEDVLVAMQRKAKTLVEAGQDQLPGLMPSAPSRARPRLQVAGAGGQTSADEESFEIEVVGDGDAHQRGSVAALDSPLLGKFKGARATMAYNFFALEKRRTKPIIYQDDRGVYIKIEGTQTHGIATIYDKEFLIYVASLMMDKINRGENVPQKFRFTIHDFFVKTGVGDSNEVGGGHYERVKGALARLKGTLIHTNIETGGVGTEEYWSWIKHGAIEYKLNGRGERMIAFVTVELCDWLYRAITQDTKILTYDRRYFDLPPLMRRVYELARAHCGNQAGVKMSLTKLRDRVGSDMDLKSFRANLQRMIEGVNLPEYGVRIVNPREVPRHLREKGAPTPRVVIKALMVVFWKLERVREYDHSAFPSVDDEEQIPPDAKARVQKGRHVQPDLLGE